MYVQAHFSETRQAVLHDLIRQHALATFICCDDTGIVVNHFPMVLMVDGARTLLRGHIPRANPLSATLTGEPDCTAVFQGPQAYVTPAWYPSKREHGKVVPTWNYAVVHAAGITRVVEDADWLLLHLNALTDQQEVPRNSPWRVSDAPAEYIDRMMNSIVGVEMNVTSLIGKWKVSQNRSSADRAGVLQGLREAGEPEAAMAALVGAGVMPTDDLRE